MSTYRAPLADMQFVLRDLAGLDRITQLPGYEDAADAADAILEEAAAFASGVLDPLNQSGDETGCTWRDGTVTTPPGFKEAYAQFAKAGWIGLQVDPEYGGQGLPALLHAPALEMWNAANVGFANGPLLNEGAIEAIELVGTDEQKRLYIPRLVEGTWMGTMCLTEPQAGSDLGQVRTKAVAEGDHYRITGQKIFITFGEHDMAENIIHLVLARLPHAPEGTKGISMFIVPKFLAAPDGSLGERNDVSCAGIEHKLGLNANPTCTMNYGERGGAIGYLVGAPHEGLKYMFIMMNAARFSVGVQGMAIADRAYQSALQYARERVQFQRIIEHPDVRRMLMSMKSQIEAMRALAYVVSASIDLARKHPESAVRAEHKAFVDLMTPVVKGWCTETAAELCSLALQVFGGIGYVEETGIAQQYRDIRVTTIYEGTTGIQAMDLVNRKVVQDHAQAANVLIARMQADALAVGRQENSAVHAVARSLRKGCAALAQTTHWMVTAARNDPRTALACSVPYLQLWGIVAGGWQMARAAKAAADRLAGGDARGDFYEAKLRTAAFYADHVLSRAGWLEHAVIDGAADVLALPEELLELDRPSPAMA